MNVRDRKEAERIAAGLDKLLSELEELRNAARQLADDEQEKFDNMSEGLQAGERGQAIEEAAANLSSYADEIDTVYDSLEEAAGNLRGMEG